jgi:cytoskeletal protein RodZ
MKKIVALMAGLLILGAAFAAAQEAPRSQEKAQVQAQAKTQTKSEFRLRNRIAFIDEDGDGINDLAKDSDGDGIPNCQDPDWVRPLDGSGAKAQARKRSGNEAAGSGYAYQLTRDADGDGVPNGQDPDWVKPGDGTGYAAQHRIGQADATGAQGKKAGQMTKAGFGKGSFRSGASAAAKVSGTGVCDGTGPKGTAQRKGRR